MGAPDLAPGQKSDPNAQKSIYGEIPQVPVLDAVEGINFDFNHGIRILFPHNGKTYHITFMDIDTGVILYSNDTVPGAFVTSVKKFYIKFRFIIHEKGNDKPIFEYDMDLKGKEVMVQLPVGTIGDSIGWFSYVERFQKKHNCRLICVMTPWIAEVVKKTVPADHFRRAGRDEELHALCDLLHGTFFGATWTISRSTSAASGCTVRWATSSDWKTRIWTICRRASTFPPSAGSRSLTW